MKKFELPVSDCDCFTGGEIGPDCFQTEPGRARPKYGVIVWYEDAETAKAACKAAAVAHWDPK